MRNDLLRRADNYLIVAISCLRSLLVKTDSFLNNTMMSSSNKQKTVDAEQIVFVRINIVLLTSKDHMNLGQQQCGLTGHGCLSL